MRAVIGFVILLVLIRIIGNKQLGQMNVFTYISGIVVGSMVADIILHSDIPFWHSMFSVALWSALVLCVELVALKSVKARELLDGQPIILVKKGKILRDALKKERLNIDDLTMMLRTNNVFSVADVEYAILEPNGDLSVLKKQEKEGVTKGEMNVTPIERQYVPTSVIIDGEMIVKSLEELGLTEEWVSGTLNRLNIKDTQDVLYAEVQEDGQLHVQTM